MRLLIAILLSIAFISCMETDAKVLQLQQENTVLQAEKEEILTMLDQVQTKVTSLENTIAIREASFDSLMIFMNNNLMDTVWIDTVRARLLRILEE